MAASSSISLNSYVEVYVWLAKDIEGYTTTSSEGGRLERKAGKIKKGDDVERCGHTSMQIFPEGKSSTYMSFWPDDPNKKNPDPAILVNSLDEEQDENGQYERTLPDVIVRLHHLNIEKMLEAWERVKKRIAEKKIYWTLEASERENVTKSKVERASCTTFVYSFLKVGGFEDKSTYFNSISGRGPKDGNFYRITKCDAGDRFWGIFNGIFWTQWVFTPKALLLRVASAAEAYGFDKQQTIEIMGMKDRVAEEKKKGEVRKVAETVVPAAALTAAIGIPIYGMINKG